MGLCHPHGLWIFCGCLLCLVLALPSLAAPTQAGVFIGVVTTAVPRQLPWHYVDAYLCLLPEVRALPGMAQVYCELVLW